MSCYCRFYHDVGVGVGQHVGRYYDGLGGRWNDDGSCRGGCHAAYNDYCC